MEHNCGNILTSAVKTTEANVTKARWDFMK